MDARTWDDFGKIDDFCTVITPHPRGSGLSEYSPEDAYALSDYAADLEALRNHLKLRRLIVMGWSHGGLVAQTFALTYPNSLSKLILLSTSACFSGFLEDIKAAVAKFKDEPWYEKSYAALKAEMDGDYETDEDMARLWVDEIRFYFRKYDERAKAYRERTKDLPIRMDSLKVFNENEFPDLDLRPKLKDVTVPTLILAGRHDFITTAKMAEEMAKHIPHAQLKIFENSGHFALVEERERFRQTIKEFVAGS
jgi:proline iminopeptidase